MEDNTALSTVMSGKLKYFESLDARTREGYLNRVKRLLTGPCSTGVPDSSRPSCRTCAFVPDSTECRRSRTGFLSRSLTDDEQLQAWITTLEKTDARLTDPDDVDRKLVRFESLDPRRQESVLGMLESMANKAGCPRACPRVSDLRCQMCVFAMGSGLCQKSIQSELQDLEVYRVKKWAERLRKISSENQKHREFVKAPPPPSAFPIGKFTIEEKGPVAVEASKVKEFVIDGKACAYRLVETTSLGPGARDRHAFSVEDEGLVFRTSRPKGSVAFSVED